MGLYDNWTAEEERWARGVEDNCKLLYSGYKERVEYQEQVKYHGVTCPYTAPQCELCDCRVEYETRVRQVARKGLLTQLAEFSDNRDCDLNPKAARGAPRVKKAKLNPELNGFLTLNEIVCDINMQLDTIFTETGRDRTYLSMKTETVLIALVNVCRDMHTTGDKDSIHKVWRLTEKWVDMARRTLNHKVADTMFGDVVCGNCGGGLAVPARVESGNVEVKCVGTPAEPPCGHTYPASEWLALYEGRKR